ncbi:MAG: YraN family protein [Candidatus Thioglobus sp.]|nr:MAG: YraN family protein [Candidatus Thioglobus sp.]KAA0456937.1 MAG: YraN family protein [Candidatus Thioglobus sp.]
MYKGIKIFSKKRQIGNQAEKLAQKYLTKNGLKFIEANYLTKMGEIDIIMLDKSSKSLVFVEVRYRQNSSFGSAVDTVNSNKQAKIILAAKHFLLEYPKYDNFICRFDIIGLESDLKCPKINWIKGAFEAI